MDDLLRNLKRAAARGDDGARRRLELELERLGPAAYPFQGVPEAPAPEAPGDEAPLLSLQNAQRTGACWVWQARTRRGAEQRRLAKQGGHRRHRSRVRQNLRGWSRDPRDYADP
jgi:hypothetical protein